MLISMRITNQKEPQLRSHASLMLWISLAVLLCVSSPPVLSQGTSAQSSNAAGLLSELTAAFSGSVSVHKIELSGEATWYAGSLEDSGTVSLTATDNGSSQMQLNLATTGQMTETQTGMGSGAHCQWSGADGVSHTVDLGNCWRPVVWFLPAFSLQPSALSAEQALTDLGEGPVGSRGATYRHLEGQINPAGLATPSKPVSDVIARTTTDIGLDPASYMPMVLTYSVHPNNGALVPIAIEVHYSDYRAVNGVRVPFHIQRYVNGSLQLDIQVSSATIG